MTVLLGILVVEAGAWNLSSSILPPTRRFHQLRTEVRSLVGRIPELNDAALRVRAQGGVPTEQYRSLVADLHATVDRMATVAGKAEGDRDIEHL